MHLTRGFVVISIGARLFLTFFHTSSRWFLRDYLFFLPVLPSSPLLLFTLSVALSITPRSWKVSEVVRLAAGSTKGMQRLRSLVPHLVSGAVYLQCGLSLPYAFSVPAISYRPLDRSFLSSLSFLKEISAAGSNCGASAYPRSFFSGPFSTDAIIVPHLPVKQKRPKVHVPYQFGDSGMFQLHLPGLSRSFLRCRTLSSSVPSSHHPPLSDRLSVSCSARRMSNFRAVANSSAKSAATAAVSPAEKVNALRKLMRQHRLDAYVVFSADAHGSEIPAPCDRRREFLTNFDGSSGTAVVTPREALLWTDGRYFVQAEQQLDFSVWKLMKQNSPGVPKLHTWLAANHEVFRVGLHGWSTPAAEYTQLLQAGFLPPTASTQKPFADIVANGSSTESPLPVAADSPSLPAASSFLPTAHGGGPEMSAVGSAATDGNDTEKQQQLSRKTGKREVVVLEENLVDKVWDRLRPTRHLQPLVVHPLQYAGESTAKKLERIQAQMSAADVNFLLLSALDDVAWLLNLRGADIPFSHVFYGYCLLVRDVDQQQVAASQGTDVPHEEKQSTIEERYKPAALSGTPTQQPRPPLAVLYTHEEMISGAVRECLEAAQVRIRPYSSVGKDLRQLLNDRGAFVAMLQRQLSVASYTSSFSSRSDSAGNASGARSTSDNGSGSASQQQNPSSFTAATATGGEQKRMLWMDPAVNVALYAAAHEIPCRVMLKCTPAAQLKAVKNAAELEGIKTGHIIDGVALCKFLLWLEQQQKKKDIDPLNEWTAAKVADTFRLTAPHSQGLSFPTIASVDANAAIVHYRPREGSSAAVTDCCTFLLDSGGFYAMGCTTDVTRTVHTAQPPDEQRRWFTLVLKGFIAVSRQKFPQGTRGPQLDALARQYLWACGVDYRHGTGHGVGSLLNVHEGPIGISPRLISQAGEAELDEGNVLSIEPGYYAQGAYGIRIENLAFVKRALSGETFKDTKFFQFEQLTMVPIQKKFIMPSLLTKEELEWLNDYHTQVWEKLSSRLNEEIMGSSRSSKKQTSVCVDGLEGVSVSMPSAEETLRWLKVATEPLTVN